MATKKSQKKTEDKSTTEVVIAKLDPVVQAKKEAKVTKLPNGIIRTDY